MIILDYSKKNHKHIIHACVKALKEGKSVVYPTDTSYGLAVDSTNVKAINKLYKIKEREFNKPVHVVVPTVAYAKKLGVWDKRADKLAKKFWPGALTLVLPLKSKDKNFKKLGAKTGTVGLRFPKHVIALDLAKLLGSPITTTGANPAGGGNAYSVAEVTDLFKDKKEKPDIIINAGKLRERKPSTLVKLTKEGFEILRPGPISENQIKRALK